MSQENEKHEFTITRRIGEPSFQDSVNSAHSHFMNDLKILRTINDLLPQAVETFTASTKGNLAKQVEKLDEEGRKQFELYLKQPIKDSLRITDKNTIEIITSFLETFMYSSRIPMFIREMSLVYLISEFESFLENILTAIFSNRPETLMSSKNQSQNQKQEKMIPYGELLGCKKIEEVKDRIIEKEIDSIMRQQDIQDVISKGLIERFKLDLVATDWEQLKEFFYRRHMVVHNNCYPDSKYRTKTGYKGTDQRLSIEKQYLEQSFTVFQRCSKLIRDSVHNKFLRK
jgi:hypothetical protein